MKRTIAIIAMAGLLLAALPGVSTGRDRPSGTSRLFLRKWAPSLKDYSGSLDGSGNTGGNFSKAVIERIRCDSPSGQSAAASVDMSCNDQKLGQDYAPDNELAIAVDPEDADHLLAGSNDYYYRFNNSTGARQAIVPTGFFTSFDGGDNWLDGQIPMRSGNGAGDPAPGFDAKHDVALMAQLENVGGQGGFYVSQGDVSVSRSLDGGVQWKEPVTVMHGTGAGIGPSNRAVFWDKEWLTVNNYEGTPSYGRIVVTATKFVNGLHGSYHSSPIFMSYSDDGGRTWSTPASISGSHPSCTFQETGDAGVCDEDQFSIPEFAPDGTLYVHFVNAQDDNAWEAEGELDGQLMLVSAPPTSGVPQFSDPVPAVELEDGGTDMPFSVIGRQTVWGHQIRWAPIGNMSVNPLDSDDVTMVFADRGTPNTSAPEGCLEEDATAENNYDPCNAGPGADTDVFAVRSLDGGQTWSDRILIDDGEGAHQWFPWADHLSDGTLAIAWDEDTASAPADTFEHVLVTGSLGATTFTSTGKEALGPEENVDVSVTHWAGQYVAEEDWPTICGPAGYTDAPVTDAEGKDCNVFHGDYTGLAVGPDDSVNVVWTGFNRVATSPQIDRYTEAKHDGYAQDAMFARR